MSRIWSLDEKTKLAENWNIPMRELVRMFPERNRKTIYYKLSDMGFRRQTYKRYTPKEDLYIVENYKTKGNYEIGRNIKRTAKSIAKRMIIMGIKREPEDFKTLAKNNKGCYQKGRVSKNAMENGTLRLVYDERINRSFYDIKIGNKFMRFSRYLYEKYFQVVLDDSDIIFHKDGNSMNVLKENLGRISRAELLRSNIDTDDAFIKRIFRVNDPVMIEKIKRENPELIELKRITMKLNQKINNHAKKSK